jgi:hypothetical protein
MLLSKSWARGVGVGNAPTAGAWKNWNLFVAPSVTLPTTGISVFGHFIRLQF